ncbi:glycosyltransferase family 2 protein [Brachyspira pilosicoli]|uniref:glycosyltransferase family 2 protein n=1 Tax=Brachyspira pilosicoli TaxID=52584 RepID=UPI0012F52A98|nr:glycosyltransferase family 2 protein [Brachyspira pilosicoli]
MNYQFTNEELLEMENKIPKYEKYVFFEKKTKYALIIAIMNEGDRFISQMNKMKEGNIFNICDVFICDGSDQDKLLSPIDAKNFGCRELIINKCELNGRAIKLKQGFYEAMKDHYNGIVMLDGNDKDDIINGLPLHLDKLDKGYDFLQSTRFTLGGKEENTPILRKIGIRFIASPLISFTSSFHYDDVLVGFKSFSRNYMLDKRLDLFREEFKDYEYYFYPLVHAKKLGYKVTQVPITRIYPKNEVPSKIKGIHSNFILLMDIIQLAFSKTKKIDNN